MSTNISKRSNRRDSSTRGACRSLSVGRHMVSMIPLATSDDHATKAAGAAESHAVPQKSAPIYEQAAARTWIHAGNFQGVGYGRCDTPDTLSSISSGSRESMSVNSSRDLTLPTNAEAPGAATALGGLSLQNDAHRSWTLEQLPSHNAAPLKRGPSEMDERPNKQLHSSPAQQKTDPRSAGAALPPGHPPDYARQRPSRLPHARQLKSKSHRITQPQKGEESRAPQPRANVWQPLAPQVVTNKPPAIVKSPTHAPRIAELDHMTEGQGCSPDRKASGNSSREPRQVPALGHVTESVEPRLPHVEPLMQSPKRNKYSGMILQPESSPISEEQLANEIKGIYDGLVTVETKCIDIDAALAHDTTSQLGVEQWQALIALHRTLLYEHHDFLMASQHPSATEELKALATKYSMAARMWKHGIHAFLEVLRHRRPESQDYMLAFVVLAYQMMALLFETVPCFTDTWIECLGDLARYRMAIEDDKEIHALWGLVAARWYTMASDRHPDIGRLYHHLGILERPSLRKLASYTKSLTCLVPFLNARDSITTFCRPIVQEENLSKASSGSAEAALVTFYALVSVGADTATIKSNFASASAILWEQPSAKVKDFGVPLVLTSISSLFEFGSQHNVLWQSFSNLISQDTRAARPSEIAMPGSTSNLNIPAFTTTSASTAVIDFYFSCITAVTRPQSSAESTSEVLAPVHTVLIWLYCLHTLGARSTDPNAKHTVSHFLDNSKVSWDGICHFLNGLGRDKQIDESVFEAARQGSFPRPRKPEEFVPLPEDYWVRGLLWGGLYLPKDLLPPRTDEIESPHCAEARVQRVQWLALRLAFRMEHFKYDVHRKRFWAPVSGPPSKVQVNRVDSLASTATTQPSRPSTWAPASSAPTSPTATSRSSTMSVTENSDGYTEIPSQKKSKPQTWAKIAAAPRKPRVEDQIVRVADVDECVQ